MWEPAYWSFFDMTSTDGWNVEGGKLEKSVCSGIPIFGGANKLGGDAIV